MSGNGKHLVYLDWLTAYEVVWKGGIVSADTPLQNQFHSQESDEESRFIDHMESHTPSPESTLLKKDAFLNLSEEAKEVVCLILNAPQEILDCFVTPKYHKVSRDKIGQFLIEKKRWKRRVVERCFRELKEFSADFH